MDGKCRRHLEDLLEEGVSPQEGENVVGVLRVVVGVLRVVPGGGGEGGARARGGADAGAGAGAGAGVGTGVIVETNERVPKTFRKIETGIASGAACLYLVQSLCAAPENREVF